MVPVARPAVRPANRSRVSRNEPSAPVRVPSPWPVVRPTYQKRSRVAFRHRRVVGDVHPGVVPAALRPQAQDRLAAQRTVPADAVQAGRQRHPHALQVGVVDVDEGQQPVAVAERADRIELSAGGIEVVVAQHGPERRPVDEVPAGGTAYDPLVGKGSPIGVVPRAGPPLVPRASRVDDVFAPLRIPERPMPVACTRQQRPIGHGPAHAIGTEQSEQAVARLVLEAVMGDQLVAPLGGADFVDDHTVRLERAQAGVARAVDDVGVAVAFVLDQPQRGFLPGQSVARFRVIQEVPVGFRPAVVEASIPQSVGAVRAVTEDASGEPGCASFPSPIRFQHRFGGASLGPGDHPRHVPAGIDFVVVDEQMEVRIIHGRSPRSG